MQLKIAATNRFLSFFGISFRIYESPTKEIFLSAVEVCNKLSICQNNTRANLQRLLPHGMIFLTRAINAEGHNREKLMLRPYSLVILGLVSRSRQLKYYQEKIEGLLTYTVTPEGDLIFDALPSPKKEKEEIA